MKKLFSKVCRFFSQLNTSFDNNTDEYVSQFASQTSRLIFIFFFACGMVGIVGSNIVMCIVGFINHYDILYNFISTFLSILGVFVGWKCLHYAKHASWHLVRS